MKRDDELENELKLAEYLQQERKLAQEKPRPRPSVNVELLAKLGINVEQFNQAYDTLCKRWWDIIPAINDTMNGLVPSTLAFRLNEPLILAMIADDITVFKKNFTEKMGDIFCLEFCCLCGSEKIVNDFYLDEGDRKHCLLLSKNAIGYALSSGNIKFALFLAQVALELGKKDPGQVNLFSFGNVRVANTIENMFTKGKSHPLKRDDGHDPFSSKPAGKF